MMGKWRIEEHGSLCMYTVYSIEFLNSSFDFWIFFFRANSRKTQIFTHKELVKKREIELCIWIGCIDTYIYVVYHFILVFYSYSRTNNGCLAGFGKRKSHRKELLIFHVRHIQWGKSNFGMPSKKYNFR